MEKGQFMRAGWKTRQVVAAAFGLATLLIAQAPARAKDGASWLDRPLAGWNKAAAALPQAPHVTERRDAVDLRRQALVAGLPPAAARRDRLPVVGEIVLERRFGSLVHFTLGALPVEKIGKQDLLVKFLDLASMENRCLRREY